MSKLPAVLRRPLTGGVLLALALPAACTNPRSAEAEPPAGSEAEPARLDAPDLARSLVETELETGGAWALLQSLCTTAPHRLSGSTGAEDAIRWSEDTMRRIGLEAVRREPCTVPRWERGSRCEVRLIDEAGGRLLPALALGGSVGTPEEGVDGPLVVVRGLEGLAEAGEAVRGAIVLFNRPMPRALRNTFQAYASAVPQRTEGATAAASLGAKAVLVRSMTTLVDDVPHTGVVRTPEGEPTVPAAAISTRAADELAALARDGTVRVHLTMDCRSLPDVASANVVGELRGRERPEVVVVIGGHLDCWDVGQGAHDDGAGVVHCLEALRLLKDKGLRPRRTIRVVLFMNEENGLRGARAYAEAHADEPHHAAIESDRGGFVPLGFTTSLPEAERERLRPVTEALRQWDMGALIPGGGGADVAPLGELGVPLFGLIPSSHRYFDVHHSERDTLERVNERELGLGAAALAWMAWSLADQP